MTNENGKKRQKTGIFTRYFLIIYKTAMDSKKIRTGKSLSLLGKHSGFQQGGAVHFEGMGAFHQILQQLTVRDGIGAADIRQPKEVISGSVEGFAETHKIAD